MILFYIRAFSILTRFGCELLKTLKNGSQAQLRDDIWFILKKKTVQATRGL